DDEQRTAKPRHLLEHRQQVLHRADLLLVDQDDGILEGDFHALGVRDEIRREVPAVELHALDDVQGGLERLGLFNGDDAVLADLVHRAGDDLADRLVVVRRDGADLRDHVAADRLRHLLDLFRDRLDRLLDAALDVHRVGAGDDVLRALAVDRLGQHGRGRRAVARGVRRLARDLAHHLRAHVLEGILEVDFLGDGHAVLVMVGDPNFLSRTTLRPLGPRVTFTASASWLTPRRIAWRDCSPYTICFAIDVLLNSQIL